MNDPQLRFSTYDTQDPDEPTLIGAYQGVLEALAEAPDDPARLVELDRWDDLRRTFSTWSNLVQLRFEQDTQDADRKARRERGDRLEAQISLLDADVKRSLIANTGAAVLEQRAGAQAISCWRADMEANAPELEEDLVTESGLVARYTALLAAARIPFQGETYSFTALGPFLVSADREVRRTVREATAAWHVEHAADLDGIYAELVALRAAMAKKLGLRDFVELGYRRMHRVDYDRQDVERFREEVRRIVVPLATELHAAQAERLGVDPLMFWDESVHDLRGNPTPLGGPSELIERGRRAFHGIHPELGAFFDGMVENELLDLDLRDGKAGGGFCTFFPDLERPFVFANCNGTEGDVRVLVHETGHAFQMWSSRKLDLVDKLHPTLEACEIHSMALEFLAWPQMEVFFGDDADRFRRQHLTDALTFLPYGVAVDHFQHLVYERPDATPLERRQMWQEMEQRYLPWRNYGDLPYFTEGGVWQRQRHIYAAPFYYIDYTLAQTCALQFWAQAFEDRERTLEQYVGLCRRGGTRPFQELARSAGLTSPFDSGCLEGVVERARIWLSETATAPSA